jgi:hypothetical protein
MDKGYYDDKFERSVYGYRSCGLCFVGIVILLLLSLLFGGCTATKYVPVETVLTDTVYKVRVERDSVFKHDSIYVKEWKKGDTIYRDRDRWHIQYVERVKTDTLYQSKVDSIAVPYPVEKELTWWQEKKIEFGELAMLIMAGLLCFVLIRYKKI